MVALFTVTVGCLLGQMTAEIQGMLRSPQWDDRRAGFERLAGRNGESRDRIRSAEVRSALVSLLNLENEVVRTAYLEGPGSSTKFGEDYSEYVAWLAQTVMGIAEKAPDTPGVWLALVRTPYHPDGAFGRWLAAHGDRVVGFLMESAQGHDAYYTRGSALSVLGQMVAYEQDPIRAHTLSASKVREIAAVVRSGLVDSDSLVRSHAVAAVAIMGDETDLALLDRIATIDPDSISNGGQSGTELRYLVREDAKRAAADLRMRLKLPRDRVEK
jgi:hypothetical protein